MPPSKKGDTAISVCPEARLEEKERQLLGMAGDEVESLHKRVLEGDACARSVLFRWAYAKARLYFCCISKGSLAYGEAENLASVFIDEFDDFQKRTHSSLVNHVNATIKKQVTFHLKARQKPLRELPLSTDLAAGRARDAVFSDEELLQLRAYNEALNEVDDLTQEIVRCRLEYEPHMRFPDIALKLSISEGKAKMRFYRFIDKARKKVKEIKKKQKRQQRAKKK